MPLTARVPRHTRPCHKATLATMVPARSLMLVSLLPLPPRLPRAPRQAMPLRHHRHHHHLTTQPKPPHRSLHGLGSTALYHIHSTCKAWRYEHCFLSRDLVRGTCMLLFVVPICVSLSDRCRSTRLALRAQQAFDLSTARHRPNPRCDARQSAGIARVRHSCTGQSRFGNWFVFRVFVARLSMLAWPNSIEDRL